MLVGFVFFCLCPSFSHPSMFTGVWILLLLLFLTLCCAPSLPNRLDRSANNRTRGISLSPAQLSSPSLPHSLSLSLTAEVCSASQSWLVFCNRLNPFLFSEGRYFLLFWLCPLLPASGILCGAVVIWKKASATLLHRDLRCHCTNTQPAVKRKKENGGMLY